MVRKVPARQVRALVVVALVVAVASPAHAAPWSIEIPPGYTEVPDTDPQLERLRSIQGTVSADVKAYLSANANVQLTRMMCVMKDSHRPTRKMALEMERGAVDGAKESGTKHISDSHHFVGDQLVSESTDEIQGGLMRRRTIFAADAAGLVNMFTVMCAGPADQLTPCENAQQAMKLTLPNPAPFINAPQNPNTSTAYTIGSYIGFFFLVVLIGMWIKSGAPIFRRKPKPDAPR